MDTGLEAGRSEIPLVNRLVSIVSLSLTCARVHTHTNTHTHTQLLILSSIYLQISLEKALLLDPGGDPDFRRPVGGHPVALLSSTPCSCPWFLVTSHPTQPVHQLHVSPPHPSPGHCPLSPGLLQCAPSWAPTSTPAPAAMCPHSQSHQGEER